MSVTRWTRAGVLLTAVGLGACAQMRSHDSATQEVQAARQTGGLPAAIKQLESTASTDDDRAALLYNLERGELLRQNRQYKDSTSAWLLADRKVAEWEEKAKTDPGKLISMLGASTISERLKPFEGQDYEKVWLTTRLALNRMADGDWESARVDIKRTHEREAVIAEFRAKEIADAEAEAQKKGVNTSGKELNGYPIETLNDPAVLGLRNGYQNALSHYLSGFLYEVMNESGLAAPGYRKAIELKPDTAVLEEGLKGLDTRTSFTHRRRQRMTDVLFVLEAGDAPARKSKQLALPAPRGVGGPVLSVSFPVIEASTRLPPATLDIAGTTLKTETIVDVNAMARRTIKDEMSGLWIRGITRAIAKGAVQKQAEKQGGPLAGLLATVLTVATEQADDRMWRSLPGSVAIARAHLPEGTHTLSLDGRPLAEPVVIRGQYAVVTLRANAFGVHVGDVATAGQLAAPVAPVAKAENAALAEAAAPDNGNVVSTDLVKPAVDTAPVKKPATKVTRPVRPAPIKPGTVQP